MFFKGAFTIILTIFSIGIQNFAHAEPIEILISIQKERVSKRFMRKVIKELEKKGFDAAEYRIHENEDKYLLHQVLMNDETKALIWISHGATLRMTHKWKRKSAPSGGMGAIPELIDYRGDNVAPVFKNYSTSLKFVSIIGCNSKQILEYVQSKLTRDDGILKLIPDRKVIAQHLIRKTIATLANQTLGTEKNSSGSNENETTTHLTIKRSMPCYADLKNIRSLRVMNGSQLITVIPAIAPGETKTFEINVNNALIRQIQLENGQNILTSPDQIEFGSLEVTHPEGNSLSLFTKKDGTPFGVNFRLFLLK